MEEEEGRQNCFNKYKKKLIRWKGIGKGRKSRKHEAIKEGIKKKIEKRKNKKQKN